MTSFFYVVSIAFHTNVPALWQCMDTSRKKVFWLRVQPLVRRLLHFFAAPGRLGSHRLFEWSKDVKVTSGSGLRENFRLMDFCSTEWTTRFEHCALEMNAASYSETSIVTYQTTRSHNLKYHIAAKRPHNVCKTRGFLLMWFWPCIVVNMWK